MAYYTALITAWNGATQPPSGVTGTGLSSNDTTAQKLAKVNAWTIVGSVPTRTLFNGKDILDALDPTEFFAKTATQQSEILTICSQSQVWGGSATFVGSFFSTVYSTSLSGPTITNLTSLAKGTVQLWTAANGYPNNGVTGLLAPVDATAAGVS